MCFFSDLHSASSIRISDVSESTLTRSKFKVDDKPPSLPRVSQLELGEHSSESTTKSEQIPVSFESMSFNTVLRNVMYFIASLRISCLESFFVWWISWKKFSQLTKGHVDMMLSPSFSTVCKISSTLERIFEAKTNGSPSYSCAKISQWNGCTIVIR